MSIFSRGERFWIFALSIILIGLFATRAWISAGYHPVRLLDTPAYAIAADHPEPVSDPSTGSSTDSSTDSSTNISGHVDISTDTSGIDANRAPSTSVNLKANTSSSTNANANTSANDPNSATFPIDINTADEETLTLLPGIGPVIAQRIVAYRTEHGMFRSVDELLNVKGIGPARFERLVGLVTVRLPASDDSRSVESGRR